MDNMKYRTVALPEELIVEVEKIRSSVHLGYRSNAEFIADAVRSKILTELSRTRDATGSMAGNSL